MIRKARELQEGDVFRLHVYGEVVAAVPVANGKRIKVVVAFENQGHRYSCGAPIGPDKPSDHLEFLDSGHVLEFICPPSRTFSLYEWRDDDDSGEEVTVPPSSLVSA